MRRSDERSEKLQLAYTGAHSAVLADNGPRTCYLRCTCGWRIVSIWGRRSQVTADSSPPAVVRARKEWRQHVAEMNAHRDERDLAATLARARSTASGSTTPTTSRTLTDVTHPHPTERETVMSTTRTRKPRTSKPDAPKPDPSTSALDELMTTAPARTTRKRPSRAKPTPPPAPAPVETPVAPASPSAPAERTYSVTYLRNGQPLSDHPGMLSAKAYDVTKGCGPDGARLKRDDFAKLLASLGVDDPLAPFEPVTLPNGVTFAAVPHGSVARTSTAAPRRAARASKAADRVEIVTAKSSELKAWQAWCAAGETSDEPATPTLDSESPEWKSKAREARAAAAKSRGAVA